jgi:glucose-1-phosphate adenylyltransferase
MQNVMGIVNLNEKEELLWEITRHRPLAAVPFAGRYRMIDFILSSMVNSGMQNVGILVRHKYRALMDHLRSGKEWDLARKHDGLFILPPAQSTSGGGVYGDIENFYANLDYIESSRQKDVIITGSGMVCNINYRKAYQFHENTKADVTVIYKEQDSETEDFCRCTLLECDATGLVTDMAVNPVRPISRKVSMEMYILSKELLMDLVTGCTARGGTDFLRDGLMKNLGTLKIYGYAYKGFLARIYSISSYYRHSIELLKPDKWKELFFKSGPVYTKVKDEAPVKYKENASVRNAMIANGCVIEGTVENSILFRGVTVRRGAQVRDSIIMQKCSIGENAKIENVICDKDVSISAGKFLKGEQTCPVVVGKGSVV